MGSSICPPFSPRLIPWLAPGGVSRSDIDYGVQFLAVVIVLFYLSEIDFEDWTLVSEPDWRSDWSSRAVVMSGLKAGAIVVLRLIRMQSPSACCF